MYHLSTSLNFRVQRYIITTLGTFTWCTTVIGVYYMALVLHIGTCRVLARRRWIIYAFTFRWRLYLYLYKFNKIFLSEIYEDYSISSGLLFHGWNRGASDKWTFVLAWSCERSLGFVGVTLTYRKGYFQCYKDLLFFNKWSMLGPILLLSYSWTVRI